MNKVYRKDLYIYNGIFAIPGVISDESLKGQFILKIKEEYHECLKEILFKNDSNENSFINIAKIQTKDVFIQKSSFIYS